MQLNERDEESGLISSRSVRPRWARRAAGALGGVFLLGAVYPAQQTPDFNKPPVVVEGNSWPNANDQMRLREQKVSRQNFEAINFRRRKQIADDSAKLLTLAIALKAELEKTGNQELSASDLRKAEEIERLAHNVKQTMALTVGPS